MATDRRRQYPTKHAKRPWHARVKRNGQEFHLGYFSSKEEALRVEREFAASYPPIRSKAFTGSQHQ